MPSPTFAHSFQSGDSSVLDRRVGELGRWRNNNADSTNKAALPACSNRLEADMPFAACDSEDGL